MTLALKPPLKPQLALSRVALPEGDGWAYEPKWDGFRCLAFVDGDDIDLQSRNARSLRRYFPELEFPFDEPCVLDGEIVVHTPGGPGTVGAQDFDLLGQRIHPAESRVKRLAQETPSTFVAFDLLARGKDVLLDVPYRERRAALEAFVTAPLELTPMVDDAVGAQVWLQGAEGVIAKELDAPYRPGERVGMVKVKRVRTADAVVVGWRPGKAAGTVGALILGMYTPDGKLREVGHSSGFSAKEKRELVASLAPYETGERGSGEPSRWTQGRDLEWIALRPELVVEVTFDHVSSGRIRHGTKVTRWRDDKAPKDCTVDQLDQ